MIHDHSFMTWPEFEGFLDTFAVPAEQSHHLNEPLLFRGQASAKWDLNDTLYRRTKGEMAILAYYAEIKNISHSFESLLDSRWVQPDREEISAFTQDYDRGGLALLKGLPSYEYLLFLRHNGFPSPLLDWSRSPYIAAFFAFREDHKDDPVIYILKSTPTGALREPGRAELLRTGEYVSAHKRHYLQQSDYTACIQFERDGFWSFSSHNALFKSGSNPGYELHKVKIARAERSSVLKQLDRYNLNAYSLFGSPESLAETMAFRMFEAKRARSHPYRPRLWSDW